MNVNFSITSFHFFLYTFNNVYKFTSFTVILKLKQTQTSTNKFSKSTNMIYNFGLSTSHLCPTYNEPNFFYILLFILILKVVRWWFRIWNSFFFINRFSQSNPTNRYIRFHTPRSLPPPSRTCQYGVIWNQHPAHATNQRDPTRQFLRRRPSHTSHLRTVQPPITQPSM